MDSLRVQSARRRSAGLRLGMLVVLGLAFASPAFAEAEPGAASTILIAQADDCEPNCDGRLEPRYQPREPEEKGWYNGSYIFGLSRGLADSSIAPAGKAPLFLFTIPLDIVLLPFAVIGGMFG